MTGIKIGKKIRLLRKNNDVTQDKLAAYLGVTPQAVSRWESEICYPDIETLPQIADFFGVGMDELLCYDSVQKETRIREYLSNAEILAENVDATLVHEAAIGKIAGEQITKLMTLGLTEKEAEDLIIKGFLS